jgi:serine/threonine protein kinase
MPDTGTKIEEFTLSRVIGTGGTSEVWEANDANYDKVAIKVFQSDPESAKSFKAQIEICKMLDHDSLVLPKRWGEQEKRPYIIFPYFPSSLMKLIAEKKAAKSILGNAGLNLFTEEEIAGILLQTSSGLQYIHGKRILHRDIKPDNILVNKKMSGRNRYAISDFGASVDLKITVVKPSGATKPNELGLTPDYASPEQIDGKESYLSDIFSLGITLYEACTGELPFQRSNAAEMIRQGRPVPNLPDGYSRRLNDLIQSCLLLDPEMRPSALELKEKAAYFMEHGYWPGVTAPPLPPQPLCGGTCKVFFSTTFVLLLLFAGIWFYTPKKIEIYQDANGKFGLRQGSKDITPASYDLILPFFSEDIITVREGEFCKWINSKGEELLGGRKCRLCKNYQRIEDFKKDIVYINQCKS